MQLSRLINAELIKTTKIKQANGSFINNHELIKKYKVIKQGLLDEVSASIYGANLNKTYRISSPRKELEKYLQTKLNNTEDNISRYEIVLNNQLFKIVSVSDNWADIEQNG